MEESKEIELINSVKTNVTSTFVKWFVGTALGCVTALVVFYFNTTYVLAQNVKDTTSNSVTLIKVVDELNNLKLTPKLNAQKIKNIESDVIDLKEGQKEIMKLLYQIKTGQN